MHKYPPTKYRIIAGGYETEGDMIALRFDTKLGVVANHWIAIVSASMVKYTTSLPCIGVSKSDTKLYTKFDFFEGNNHKHLGNSLIDKAKQIMSIK